MTIKIINYTLPTHWATALINGDTDHMDADDENALDQFTCDNTNMTCVSVEDDENFVTYHDARDYGVLACHCSTFVFHKE